MLTRDAVLVQDARYGAVPRVFILGLPHDKSTTLIGLHCCWAQQRTSIVALDAGLDDQ